MAMLYINSEASARINFTSNSNSDASLWYDATDTKFHFDQPIVAPDLVFGNNRSLAAELDWKVVASAIRTGTGNYVELDQTLMFFPTTRNIWAKFETSASSGEEWQMLVGNYAGSDQQGWGLGYFLFFTCPSSS